MKQNKLFVYPTAIVGILKVLSVVFADLLCNNFLLFFVSSKNGGMLEPDGTRTQAQLMAGEHPATRSINGMEPLINGMKEPQSCYTIFVE